MITCKRCGNGTEKDVELHHLIPKCIGGTDKDGRKYLCKKCHNIWHNMIIKFIFKFVHQEEKEKCKHYVKEMCLWFIGKK